MLSQFSDFCLKRSGWQALGFYVVYLIALAIGGGALSFFLAPFSNATTDAEAFEYGAMIGSRFAMVMVPLLTYMVIKAKGYAADFGYLVVVALSLVLAILAGGLLGLIPVAYITTFEPKIATKNSTVFTKSSKATTKKKVSKKSKK